MHSLDSNHIIVGMSGGVDSSVAALLLKQQGHRVSGLFMKNWDEDDGEPYCTAKQDLEDATQVCERIGIELHTANFAAEYWDDVFSAFLREYEAGRTPNPDVLCNREIKFKQFARYAEALGADQTATGHYARIAMRQAGVRRLLKGTDASKDQSYFLQALNIDQLSTAVFPLGDMKKTEVRRIAREQGFDNHGKKDSTGICFIGERRFRDFLHRYLPHSPGPMVDQADVTVGEHIGLPYYTRGQRQGLAVGGLAGRREAPWYVLDKDMAANRLIVTQDPAALCNDGLIAPPATLNWLGEPPPLPLRCTAKVRHRQPDQAAWVSGERAGLAVTVRFDAPQRAITPGQYVCFYDGDICLGGGVIESFRQLRSQPPRQ